MTPYETTSPRTPDPTQASAPQRVEPATEHAVVAIVEAVLDGSLPHERWTHAAHLALGVWMVNHYELDEAIARVRAAILAYNDRVGIVSTPTSGYHETITCFWTRYIASVNRELDVCASLEDRYQRVLSRCSEPALLGTYYSRELLKSPRARRRWVAPDRADLPGADATVEIAGRSGGTRNGAPRDSERIRNVA